MKGKDIALIAAIGVGVYLLYGKKAGETLGAASDTGGAIGGILQAPLQAVEKIKEVVSGATNTTSSAAGAISAGVSQVDQMTRGGLSYGMLAAGGIQTQPTIWKESGILSLAPMAGTPPTAINDVARAIEKASVATGYGNFQTLTGAVMYIPQSAASSLPKLAQAGAFVPPTAVSVSGGSVSTNAGLGKGGTAAAGYSIGGGVF